MKRDSPSKSRITIVTAFDKKDRIQHFSKSESQITQMNVSDNEKKTLKD